MGALVILLLWSLLAYFGLITMGPMAVASSVWNYICSWIGAIADTAVGGQRQLLFTNRWAKTAMGTYASDQVQTRALGCAGGIGGGAATGVGTAVITGLGKFLAKAAVPGAGWAAAIGSVSCFGWSGVQYVRDLYGYSPGGAFVFNLWRDGETVIVRTVLGQLSGYILVKAYNKGIISAEALKSMVGIKAGLAKVVHSADKIRKGIEKESLKQLAKADAGVDSTMGTQPFMSYETLNTIQEQVLNPMIEKEKRGEKVTVGKKQEAAYVKAVAIAAALEANKKIQRSASKTVSDPYKKGNKILKF